MSYSYSSPSDPPGTKWLKASRQRRPTQDEQAQIDKVSDSSPQKGDWQFAISPFGETWNVLKSYPDRDTWNLHSTHYDLGDAMKEIQILRANPR